MTVKTKEEIITIIPEIFAVFISNPYPISQTKCLIPLKIWKAIDQVNPIKINFPVKLFIIDKKDE